jgi:hypothetical protein
MNIKPLLPSLTNAALYLAACALIGTGLLLELRMDEEDGGTQMFGMGQDDWGEIHLLTAITFAGLVILHLVQKTAWIKAAFRRSKLASGVLIAGLAVIAGLLLWPTTSAPASLGESLRHILSDD